MRSWSPHFARQVAKRRADARWMQRFEDHDDTIAGSERAYFTLPELTPKVVERLQRRMGLEF